MHRFVVACLFLFILVTSPALAAELTNTCCLCQIAGQYEATGEAGADFNGNPVCQLDKVAGSGYTACQPPVTATCASDTVKSKLQGLNAGPLAPLTPPDLQVDVPGFPKFTTDVELDDTESYYEIPWIAEYINAVYRWGVGIAGVLAVIMVIVGGLTWMTAGGNSGQVETAKTYIIGALTGLVLALGSYTILWLVNPELVKLKPLRIPYVKNVALQIGPRLSAYLIANPGQEGKKDQFNNAGCPTKEEAQAGFDGFITAYYAPAYGEKGYYKSFECNLAMQCSCPKGKDEGQSCGFPAKVLSSNFSDHPCNPIAPGSVPGQDYCNKSSSGAAPVAYKTAAADITTSKKCWSVGDQFVIEGIGGQAGGIWTVQDQGSDIKGRHFDLFIGSDLNAAKSIGGVYKIKFTKCQKCGF